MQKIYLRRKIAQRIENGHPWIFGNEVDIPKTQQAAGKPGVSFEEIFQAGEFQC